jgi:hypothetical protein
MAAKKKRTVSGNALDVTMTLPSDAELKKMFDAVPQLRKHDVMAASVRAATQIISKKAKELAPRSTPEDRKKRSKTQRKSADWEGTPLHTTIGHVVRKYDKAAFGVAGPRFPHGNKAYFNQPRSGSRRHVLWGRDVGRVMTVVRNWMMDAFEMTQSQQLSAMKKVLKQKLDEMWLHV